MAPARAAALLLLLLLHGGALAAKPWRPAGQLPEHLTDFSLTELGDGRLLIAGGLERNRRVTARAFVWSQGNGLVEVSPLGAARQGQAAVRLADGRVLIAGGGFTLATAEVWDGTRFVATGSMAEPRYGATAALLADGRVLVAGGQKSDGKHGYVELETAEIWDPATGRFTPTGAPHGWHTRDAAFLLKDGCALFIGEVWGPDTWCPSTGTFSSTKAKPAGEPSGFAWSRLPDGRFLLVGGESLRSGTPPLADAAVYDPATDRLTATGSLHEAGPRAAAVLADGRVVAVGDGDLERWDPGTGVWTGASAALEPGRTGPALVALPDGRVLIVAGAGQRVNAEARDESYPLGDAWLWDPAADRLVSAGKVTPRIAPRAILLPSGDVVVVGGYNGQGGVQAIEVGHFARKP